MIQDTLQQLYEKKARKAQLDARLKEMRAQKESLRQQLQQLDAARLQEQADVDRLEKRSLAALFYAMLGKKEERLQKEQQEALAAAVKYENAAASLHALEADISACWSQACALQGCDREYDALLQQRRAALRTAATPAAENLLHLEEEMAGVQNRCKEIEEAIAAGARAQNTAQKLLAHLQSAQNWGTWDMFGGGLVSDIAKYSALNEAQTMADDLQVALRRYKTELVDVQISADLQVNVEGFVRFADFFFDGLFADWAALERITATRERMESVCRHIQLVQDKLTALRTAARREYGALQQRADELVRQTEA